MLGGVDGTGADAIVAVIGGVSKSVGRTAGTASQRARLAVDASARLTSQALAASKGADGASCLAIALFLVGYLQTLTPQSITRSHCILLYVVDFS